jgi:hypothetical protein
MQSKNEIPHFGLYKQYLRTGEIPADADFGNEPFDFRIAQALLHRRHAIVQNNDGNKEDAASQREMSRQALREPQTEVTTNSLKALFSSVGPSIFQELFSPEHLSSESATLEKVVGYLQGLGFSKENGKDLPVLSNMPPEILAKLQSHFKLNLIAVDQVGITDFENVLS